ncbi:MAG: hypothetical protein WBZ20_07045, partial [Nitrososphaeraceae archaeon]
KRQVDLAGTIIIQCGDNTNTFYSNEYKIAKKDGSTATGRVQKIIANKIGLSPATYYRAKKIIEESPELVKDKVRSGSCHYKQSIQPITKRRKKKISSSCKLI